jgi:hypothetical protein
MISQSDAWLPLGVWRCGLLRHPPLLALLHAGNHVNLHYTLTPPPPTHTHARTLKGGVSVSLPTVSARAKNPQAQPA